MSWPIVELKDTCSLLTDGTHYTPPDVGKGIPFLTVKDVSEDGLDFQSCSRITLDEYQKANAGNSAPKVGDVLFSKDGTVGKVHVVKENEPFAVLSSLAILRPNENVDSGYLGYALKSPQTLRQASQNKTGSALRRIILSDIKTLKIPLPPLAEQKRIAAILDKADAIRRKRQQAIQLADQFLRAVFLDMFGQKSETKSYLIGELCEVKGGKRLPAGHDYVSGKSDYPYLRVVDFLKGTIDQSNLKFIDYETRKKIKRYTITSEDVFISIAGSIGISGTVPSNLNGANLTENAAKLVIRDKKKLSNEYLAYWLNTPEAQALIANKTMSTSQPKLALFRIEELHCPLPSLEEQIRFVNLKRKVFDSVSKAQNSNAACNELFNALSQKAFAGEL